MNDIAEAIYQWTERHTKAIKIGTAIAFIALLILEGAFNNGLI